MLGYYNYSVILTYFGLVSTVLGMSYLFNGEKEAVIVSVVLLMISGVCDMFDGAIASKCKRNEEEKMFGIQIDSLCDLVCFGVFPGILVYKISGGNLLSKVAFVLIVLTSVIRLGYFDVQEHLRDKQEKREDYEGLPVTLTALFVPFMLIIGGLFKFDYSIFMPIVLIVESGSEVLRFKIKKPYGAGKVILALIGIMVLVGVFVFKNQIIESVL